MEEELLRLEGKFWRGDADFHSRDLTENSLMVFPAPAGILTREQVIETVSAAPRWSEVLIEDVSTFVLGSGLIILIDKVRARRGETDPQYVKLASSIYVQSQDTWKLAFH
jgi:hypothetical protein